MTDKQTDQSFLPRPLRLWPGVALAILALFLLHVLPLIYPEWKLYGFMGYALCAVLIILWWLFFSRAPWRERLGALVAMILAVFLTTFLIHESIAKGAMGMLFYILAIPAMAIAFVLWAVVTRHSSMRVRRVSMVLTIFLSCAAWILIRTGGFTGEGDNDFAWRWSETPEEKLVAKEHLPAAPAAPASKTGETPSTVTQQPATAPIASTQTKSTEESKATTPSEANETAAVTETKPVPVQAKEESPAEWPGFRGPERNGIVRGIRINTDWSASPPQELWRRQIGPGWSSFAVQGNLLFTQEQRGDDEVVSCYDRTTGEPVWAHNDRERFWESNAGAGPRGTPTLHNGRVYALGATGILNALNASDGTAVWSRNAAKDTNTKIPGWGFSSSPLIVDDVVIVATAGQLVGYNIQTGEPLWYGPKGGTDYSSPHLVKIGGVTQVLLLNGPGAISVAPATGSLLWKHAMPSATRIIQPAVAGEGDVLVTEGDSRGMRRIAVSKAGGSWTVKERWTSIGLKPYFSDFVIHDGHAFGFDGAFLSCINLADGNKKWKGGRYGHGQLVLLPDQDLLLVLSEKGELALVKAGTDEFNELARFKAIEGKTWNHPVLVGDVLLVRNGQEMAAFRLATN